VFEDTFRVPAVPLAGLTAGVIALTVVVGLANSREVIRRTPLEILRQE
jgi:putative ABC transport system permease protein